MDSGDRRQASAYEDLFTESQSWDDFERRLDLAHEIGATRVELTQAGNPSGAEYLLRDAAARERLLTALADRDLKIEALNCSGMPLHPTDGERFQRVIRATIELAGALGVDKIVSMSGVGGDGADASTINWVFYPFPASSVQLAERQWGEAVALWSGIAETAARSGVTRIALELHPLHLVYNVPTLLRFREAVGPVVGANVDPSHLFWQQMDPVAVVGALGDALFHIQLKDTKFAPEELALAGVLDDRAFTDPQRAWTQRTIGQGHDAGFWRDFLTAIRDSGYRGAVCIENEDPYQSYDDGVREAAGVVRPLVEAL